MLIAPSRQFRGRVELYDGSTLLETFCHTGALQSFTVDRAGESSKFFGFGVCQKLTVKLRDRERKINIVKGQGLEISMGVGCDYVYPCPIFFVDEVKRDENNNNLTITAYDAIHRASEHAVDELTLPDSYTIGAFAAAVGNLLGMPIKIENIQDTSFELFFETGANIDGTETIRRMLDAVAEATQTIYYMNNNWELTFRRLDKDGEPVLEIPKSQYFSLSSKTNHTLSTIMHVTELGDNVHATIGIDGETQYVRENPFWNLRSDIGEILENAVARVGGTTINQFECKWRGNFLLELGDKVGLITKDDEMITAYIMDDSITFDGGYVEKTKWDYEGKDGETASNPSTLGDALKYTYARVNKAENTIELVSSEVDANSEAISSLSITTSDITASVSQMEQNISSELDGVNEELVTIRNSVEAKMTAEDVTIKINEELSNGVDKITTTTGFTFDDIGLTIEKSGSEMSTQITEDGMTVFRDAEAVLVANNEGVKAEDLHATTYLIVGNHSRFEDYGDSRTGCFWIGG
jgi:hypothetical protein